MMTMEMRIMRTIMVMMRTIINDLDNDGDGDKKDDDDVDENGRTDNHGTSYSSLLLLAAQPFLPASLALPGQRTQTLHYGRILNTKENTKLFLRRVQY